MERFEDILMKKEEACVKHYDVKKEKKAERFNMFMTATKKNLKLEEKTILEEKKVEIATALEDSKRLTLKMDDLNEDARMIMQAVHVRMLKCFATELETSEKEATSEEEPTTE